MTRCTICDKSTTAPSLLGAMNEYDTAYEVFSDSVCSECRDISNDAYLEFGSEEDTVFMDNKFKGDHPWIKDKFGKREEKA